MNEKKGDWHEVDAASRDGSLYEADLSTLKRYLRFVTDPPPSSNEAFHARLKQVADTIRELIAKRETSLEQASEAALREMDQEKKDTQDRLSLRWGRIAALATIVGALAAIVGLYFMFLQGR